VSVWLRAPARLDCVDLAQRALREGVVIERGDVYFSDPAAHRNHIRLGFGAIAPDAIRPGVAILGRLVREQLGR
jgi:GntR family transcriptional regulator/MocR family aminotransferase